MSPLGEATRSEYRWKGSDPRCRFALSRHSNLAVRALLAMVLSGWMIPVEAKRIALVVGNDTYQSVTPLQNARSDARAVAHALERDGFTVTLKEDLTLKAMKDALRSFKQQISGGDEAVFYYSGHGVQFGGTNYLIPVDLVPQSEAQVVDDAIPLQRVLDDLQDQKTGFALAIVDACRDNPFKGTGRAIGGRGLAPVTAATGQMVLYSAGAGQQALDRLGPKDTDPNGVFTRVLIREMLKPGVTAGQMLKNVRDEVVTLARGVNHEQVPALYDQSIGDFCFLRCVQGDGTDHKSAAELFAQLASTRSGPVRQKLEQQLWERLRQWLPQDVPYGFVERKEGAPRLELGFEPATAASDGRTATVTIAFGEQKDGRISFDHQDTIDYKVDCSKHEFVTVRYSHHGGVRYPDEAERKRDAFIPKPNSGEYSLGQALCGTPLRITPLWALQNMEWTELGAGMRAALKIVWSDPKQPNERYALLRHDYAKPKEDGAEVEYWWLGLNCSTRELHDTGKYYATARGEIISVSGHVANWEPVAKNSVGENAYVLICRH